MNKEQQIEEIAEILKNSATESAKYFQREIKKAFKSGAKQLKRSDCEKSIHDIAAEALYNAGYRKTFTSDLASDTQKAYKEGYIKGIEETEAEIERLKADNEALTMWNNASAETIQKLSETNKRFASNMKSVLEIEKKNAVKEFAERLKMKAFNKDMFNDWAGATYVVLVREIDELLKEYEQ